MLINKQNNGKFKLQKLVLLQSGIIPLSFLPTSGLFCKDATPTFIIIIIIFITYTTGTNKHTHEKNKIFKNTH